MSAFLISLIVAAGSGVWVFYKFQNRSGNNTRQSFTASAVTAVILFIFLLVIFNSILK